VKVVFGANILVSAVVFPDGRGEQAPGPHVEERDQFLVFNGAPLIA